MRLHAKGRFSPVARFDTICTVLVIAAQNRWNVYQYDVQSAVLNKVLNEEVYVQQPESYVVAGHEEKVYHLRKVLYSLKSKLQEPGMGELMSVLIELAFKRVLRSQLCM